MNSALFAWLVAGELRAGDAWVGIAQSSTLWPSLAFLLLGGATADRVDPRRLLVFLHAAAAIPVSLLAVAVATERISLAALIAYGLGLGTVSAFVMPARDALLSRVAGPDLMRSVTAMTAVQFGSQAVGSALAAGARWVGSAPALLLQALLLLAGSFTMRGVPSADPPRDGPHRAPWHDIAEGLRIVATSPRLRDPVLLVSAVGLFFIGPFLAVFPVLVVDHYHGTVARLSMVAMLFPLGTIVGSLLLQARGGVRRKGLASLVALSFGASALGVIGFGLPFAAMVAATFAWGLGGALFINCSRTLYQEAAPAAQRGRVLAVYQLGFVGTAPIGTLWSGFASALLGPHRTLQICALAMLSVVALVALRTDIARME
jgi:MFS family permease